MSEQNERVEVVQWLTPGGAWPTWGRGDEESQADRDKQVSNMRSRHPDIEQVEFRLRDPRGGVLVEIDGPLGGGKTTFARRLAEYLEGIALIERIDGNDSLLEYGERMGDWFWHQQCGIPYPEKDMFELARAQIGSQWWFMKQSERIYRIAPDLAKDTYGKLIAIEPSHGQNKGGYNKVQRELLNLSPDDEAFIDYTRESNRNEEEVVEPWAGQRLLVNIDLDPEIVLGRIGARMKKDEERKFEGGTPAEYVDMLNRRLKEQAWLRALAREPVLIVDGSVDFRNGGEAIDQIASAVEELRRGREAK